MTMSLTSIAAKLYTRIKAGVTTVSRGLMLAGAIGLSGLVGCHDDDDKSTTKNYWVQVLDSAGNPAQGAELSLYDASVYDIDTDGGDATALTAKAAPDRKTDADGNAYFQFPDGKQHIVVVKYGGHLTQKLFKLNNLQTANSPNFIVSQSPGNDGNVEFFGHIKHDQSFPQGGNKFVIGEYLPFVIKGVNNSAIPADASFKVYRDLPGPADPLVYAGTIGAPLETITADAQGGPNDKPHKTLQWLIDNASISTWGFGKYKIDTYWNESGVENSHLLGIFFVEQDTTPPTVNSALNYDRFTNQTLDVSYTKQDTPQPGTVRAATLDIQSVDSSGTIYADLDTAVDSSGDGNPANDIDVILAGSPGTLPARGEVLAPAADVGKNAKSYTIRLWTMDSSGNIGSIDIGDLNFLTKAEADTLAGPIYDLYKIGPSWDINYFTDLSVTTTKTATVFSVLCNKVNTTYQVGHNYNGQGGLTPSQASELEAVISALTGPEFIKPISKDTKAGYTTTLTNYLQNLKDNGFLPP